MAVTTDNNFIGLFKTTYSMRKPEDIFFQNSSLAKMCIQKIESVGGKEYKIPILAGNIANASGDGAVTQTKAAAYGSSPNLEFTVTPGQIFAGYFITLQEEVYSAENAWAYTKASVNKFAQCLDSFRKMLAISLYGSGFGEIGQVGSTPTIALGANTVSFTDDVIVKLSIGSDFRFTNGDTPASALRTSVNTVTKIDGNSVTFTATAADGLLAATDWIEINGCRSGATPLLPRGLSGWAPTVADRVPGSAWDAFIATAYYGVDRSVNTSGLAGQFVKQGSPAAFVGEEIADAIVRLLKQMRVAGAEPNIITMHPNAWHAMGVQLGQQTNLMQQINTSPQKKDTNAITKGFETYQFSFSSSWLEYVYPDPFCEIYKVYMMEKDILSMTTPVNVKTPGDDGIPGNDPGKKNYTEGTQVPTEDYTWWIDEYVTINPVSTMAQNGSSKYVVIQFFGNWVVYNPSKVGVAVISY